MSQSSADSIPVAGILGGIGSGKSSVVKAVEGLNVKVIDADRIGHELLTDSEISAQIRQRFGGNVFDSQGQVDRPSLAEQVFGAGSDYEDNRRGLERILHPAIRRVIESEIESTSQDVDVIVIDAALLLEAGWAACCDKLIFIHAPKELRAERVVRDRGWQPGELERRESTQWSVDRKKRLADFVVDNSSAIEAAASRMKQIFESLVAH